MGPRLLFLVLLGCRGKDDASSEPCSGTCVEWDEGLVLRRDGEALFVLSTLSVATVEAYDDLKSYDPFYDDGTAKWTEVTRGTGSAPIALTFDDGRAGTIDVTETGDGQFALHLAVEGNVSYVRFVGDLDDQEGVYGLGEYFDAANHRGRTRALQIEVDPELESFYNEAHVPVPLAIGTRGWGLFVADRHPMVVDVGAADPDRIVWTTGLGPEGVDGIDFHLFAEQAALDVTRSYYEATAFPVLPDPWALGPLYWRDENASQAEVEADLQAIRDRDLAGSGAWIDRPYASGVNTFDFDPKKFSDPDAMIDLAHDLGFRLGLWHTPYVSAEESTELHEQAVAGSFYPPTTSVNLNGWGTPIDFSNPDAVAWWQALVARYTERGIEGFKLDYGEDIVVGGNGYKTGWTFHDGSDVRTMHKRYAALYHAAYADLLPASGGFLLARAGTWGDQVSARVIWPGDLSADLSRHGEVLVEDGEPYGSVGGLHAAIVAGLSLGPSGFPFFGSDTGGYRRSPPDAETFIRWFQHTALSTVMQVGNSASLQPWEMLGEEELGWFQDYARLHLRLFPTTWTYANALLTDGRPIQRPLGLVYPELIDAPSEAYLYGDWLLVNPVVDAGAVTKDVVFPSGRWIDWFTGEVIEGGGTVTVDAPLETLPLHLQEGGIVALLRESIDTLAPVALPSIDSFDTDPGVLTLRVFPGPETALRLYDGALVSQRVEGGVATLSVTPGNVFIDGFVFEVVGFPVASVVGGDWVEEDGLVRVTLPAAGGTITLTP